MTDLYVTRHWLNSPAKLENALRENMTSSEHGQMERTIEEVVILRDNFVQLLCKLHEKGLLSDDEALAFLPGYKKADPPAGNDEVLY